MTHRRLDTRPVEIYGISGAKGHGKDTFCNLILENVTSGKTNGWNKFSVFHFADDLKQMASRIFNIPLGSFIDPQKKEVPFDIPLDLDLFVPAMAKETALPILPRGLIARTPRDIMQLFGTEYVRSIQDDYWICRTIDKIRSEKRVLIPDTRFVKEADKIKAINGRIIEIIRIDLPDSGDRHSSETERSRLTPDLVIGVRTGDLSLPTRVAHLIAMGKFNSAKRYDYRAAKNAILAYQSGSSLETSSKLLGENHKDPYCLKNILEYYGIPFRKRTESRVEHKVIDGIVCKWCSKCSSWKRLGEFNNNTRSWDRLSSKCAVCASNWQKSRYVSYSRSDNLKVIFSNSQRSAKYRNIEFKITIENVEELFSKQGGKCFYSGRNLELEPGSPNKLTIDRIDSIKGYVYGNVVLCSYTINMMKRAMSVREFSDTVCELAKNSSSWLL